MSALDVMMRGEIARRLGVDRERAGAITRRKGFPRPCARIAAGRIWLAADVEKWAAEHWDEQ